ncbi:MAG: LamG-like jellyroll fold domain-containing protein [Phycisphaerales bacterium]
MTFRLGSRMIAGLAAVAAVGLHSAAEGQICQGLLAQWTFDAGNFTDLSGNGHNLAPTGVTLRPGIAGDAVRTTDTPQAFLQTPNATLLNPSTGITLSAWVRDSAPGSGNEPIIDKGAPTHSSPFYQYHLGVASDFLFDLAINGTRRTVRGGDASPGTWRHVVGTYNGAVMRLYVDGVQISSLNVSGTITAYTRPVFIGRFGNLSNATDATIDEVRIYGRALSAAEVAFLTASPTGQPLVTPGAATVCRAGSVMLNAQTGGGVGVTWEFEEPSSPEVWTPVVEGANNSAGDGTLTFTASGAISESLTLSDIRGGPLSGTGVRLRAVVTGACGPATSDPATLTSCPTDFNCDGFAEPGDLDEFITTFFAEEGDPARAACDFNGDGFVEPGDLDEFITAFFDGC